VTQPWKTTRISALTPVLAFLAFLALALSWSLGVPLLSAADEPEHVVRAAAAVRGEFNGQDEVRVFSGSKEGLGTPDFLEVVYRLPHSLVTSLEAHDPGCYSFQVNVTPNCVTTSNAAKTKAAGDTDTSHMNYTPVYYLATGWPSLFLSGDAAIYGMRVASAVITALMLAGAFTTSVRRRGAAAIGVLAAATPVAIYFGSVVNPSGPEISSALLAWASFLSLVRAEPGAPGVRRDRILFAISAAVLIVVRPLGPVWVAAILAATLIAVAGGSLRERITRVLNSRGVRWTGALLALALVGAGLWDVTQNTMGIVPEANPDYTYAKGVYLTVFQTPGFLSQMLGSVGWIDTRVPTFTTMLWYGAISGLVLLALVLGNRRERFVLVMLTVSIVLFPIVFEAYSGRDYGVGWQGRYTLPLAVGLPILAAEIAVRRLSAVTSAAVARSLATMFGATIALAYLCEVWWVWRRYAQGMVTGHVLPMPAKWSPPIGWAAVLALAAVGCVTLFLMLRHASLIPAAGLDGGSGDGPAVETERSDADGTDGTETVGAATARSAGARSGDEAAPAAEKTDPADQPAEELPGKLPGRPLPAVAQPAPTTAS
jgi:hypothetical protein